MLLPPTFYSAQFFAHPSAILTEEEARSRHVNGKDYYFISKPIWGGHRVLSLNTRIPAAAMDWLDSEERTELVYGFKGYSGRLFLETAQRFVFDPADGEVREFFSFRFSQNDTCTVFRTLPMEQRAESWTTEFDSSYNWEDIPVFGEYDSIMRKERVFEIDSDPVRVTIIGK